MGVDRHTEVVEPAPASLASHGSTTHQGTSPSLLLRLQRSAGNQVIQRTLAPDAAAVPLGLSAFSVGRTEALEREADHAAAEVLHGRRRRAPGRHSPPCSCGGTCAHCRAKGIQKLGLGDAVGAVRALAGVALESAGLTSAVIVEDGTDLQPDQIHRSDFIARARTTICSAANEELQEVGATATGCPYIQHWIGRFASRPARQMERMVALYARPEQRTPAGFLSALEQRVRQGVQSWKTSGRVEGVSEQDVTAFTGGGVQRQAASTVPPSPRSDSPEAVRGRLGSGHALPPRVRGSMEHGFGVSFADVRVHTGSSAASIATEQRALALTVGQDIVMASGAWRPGTPAGDALLAHELAHTIQQRGGDGAAHTPAHEDDADQAAMAALTGAGRSRPKRRVGLTLQACKPTEKRCPPGMRWGTVADPTSMGTGSFGCTCVYRCITDPVYQPQQTTICPATGCSRVEIVGEEYHFTRAGSVEVETAPVSERAAPDERTLGWGGSATPLTGPAACLCPGVDIQGEDRTEGTHMESIVLDLTDFDMGASPRTGVRNVSRPRRRPGGSQHTPSRGRPHPESPHPHVTQTQGDWCGAACGEMAARRLGVEIPQEHLAAHPSFQPTTIVEGKPFPGGFQTEGLTQALRDLAPAPGRDWIGGVMREDISTPATLRTQLGGLLESSGGSVILRTEGLKHWIIVDQVLPDGSIAIRNPRDQVQSIVTAQELSNMGPTGELVVSLPTRPREE